MTPRRTAPRLPGSGSVYPVTRPNGQTYYRASVELGLVGGRRKRKTFSGRNEEAVKRRLNQFRRRLESPDGQVVVDERMTFKEWLTTWLTGRENIRPSTAERYRQALARVPEPVGRIRLSRLTPEDLEACYRQLRDDGMAPAGVLKVHRVIHAALERAFRRGYVLRNVAALVDAPRVPHREVQTITAAQALKLLEAANDDRYEGLYYLAVTTGMRQGELLALRWQDIDWAAGAVMVRGSLRNGKRTETKTGRERRVSLAPLVVERLRDHEHRQKVERMRAGTNWRDTGTVFASSVGTPTTRQCFNTWSWYKIRARAGLGDRQFKDATRHAAASLLVAAGIQPRIVSDILGHSQIALTMNTYSHVLPGAQDAAAAVMERMLRGQ